MTFGELEATSNQGAQLFRKLGLNAGDHIAIMLENHPRFLQICWAAQRAGLYYTAISWRLQQQEVEYIVNNCEARVFITSNECREVAHALNGRIPNVEKCYMLDAVIPGYESWEAAIASMPKRADRRSDRRSVDAVLIGNDRVSEGHQASRCRASRSAKCNALPVMTTLYGADENSIYLSPAPLYHAAPLGFSMACLRNGIQVVVMEHFEAERALQYIERTASHTASGCRRCSCGC